MEELFDLPKWAETPGSPEFTDRYVKLLTDLSVAVNAEQNARKSRPKIFVARYPTYLQVDADTDVDLILVQLGYGKSDPVLYRERCEGLAEDQFHQHICDTLAEHVQAGTVNPVEINKLLE